MCNFYVLGRAYVEGGGFKFVHVVVEPRTDLDPSRVHNNSRSRLNTNLHTVIDHSFVCVVKLTHPTANVLSCLRVPCVSFLLTRGEKKACCCHSRAPPTLSCLCRLRASTQLSPIPPPRHRNPSWTPQKSSFFFSSFSD